MTTSKKVLIITYYWPPSGGPGVQRWLKFVKYLPDYGVQPIVLTVDPTSAEYPIIDKSLETDIAPDLQVFRTECKGVYDWYKKITGTKTIPYSGFANEGNPSFIQKIARFVRGNFFLPDARRGWIKYAFREASRLIEQEGVDTVITTGPPHSTHLTGLKLKKKYAIKWIVDFRDPWTDIYYNHFLYQTNIAKRIDARYEQSVLDHCDHLLVVADNLQTLKVDPDKVSFSPNGYDELDFFGKHRTIPTIFTICFTGIIAANYPLDGLLDALADLKNDTSLKIRFVGKVDAELQAVFNARLGTNVEFIDFVPHNQSIDYLFSASILLLLIPQFVNDKYIVTGKLFEYLASGAPILLLGTTSGIAAKIVRKAGAGASFEYHDTEGIKTFLRQQAQGNPGESHQTRDFEYIQHFGRKALTQRLSRIISEPLLPEKV